MANLRWIDGVLIMDKTVIGSIGETASGTWEAHGSLTDWQDTDLGIHEKKSDAKLAVMGWVAKMQGETD